MARPTQNASDGTWSLTQVAKAAGIKMRTARTLVNAAWLPEGNLTVEHVLIARVSAALLDAPRPPSEGRGPMTAPVQDRYRRLLDEVYRLLGDPNTAALALISPTETLLARTISRAMSFLEEQDVPQAVLILPVGKWAEEVSRGRR